MLCCPASYSLVLKGAVGVEQQAACMALREEGMWGWACKTPAGYCRQTKIMVGDVQGVCISVHWQSGVGACPAALTLLLPFPTKLAHISYPQYICDRRAGTADRRS